MDKEEYDFLKRLGLCPVCKTKNDSKIYIVCANCREDKLKYYKQYYKSEEYRQMKSNKAMERYNKRKENGICVICGKNNAAKGKVKCEFCLAKKRAYSRKAYSKKIDMSMDERRDNGICIRCNSPVYKDFKLCKEHYDALLERGFRNRKYRNDDFLRGWVST